MSIERQNVDWRNDGTTCIEQAVRSARDLDDRELAAVLREWADVSADARFWELAALLDTASARLAKDYEKDFPIKRATRATSCPGSKKLGHFPKPCGTKRVDARERAVSVSFSSSSPAGISAADGNERPVLGTETTPGGEGVGSPFSSQKKDNEVSK